MHESLSPPGNTQRIQARSALVLAPHFDDEVLGCGGLLTQLIAGGAAVRVLFLSDGSGGAFDVDDPAAYRARRRAEAGRAAEVLGLTGSDRLDLPDGALDQDLERLAAGIRRALLSQRPELVLVTSPLEVSADHRAAFAALHRVLGGLRGPERDTFAALRVLAYEINHPLYPDVLVDVSAEVERIEEAMACYESQQERHDYLAARLGLARFRALTLAPGVTAVEAYRSLGLDDFITRGPARLVAALGGTAELHPIEEGPRISVIVRTRDRPAFLAEALASLAASTWRRLEVLVVNDGGKTPELPADFPLEIRLVDLEINRGRAAAANAGLDAATGDWVAFLDDDDLVEPEHYAALAAMARGAGVRVVYSDAAVGVYEIGTGGRGGWRQVERRLPYSRDFDAELLLFDNYIPFNTLLIERELARETGRLDEELPFFEDWDFLLRLAARAGFHHLPRVTCEYRHFRGAGHHILGDVPRRRDDFLEMKARVFDRHAERRSSAALARVIDRLRAETVAAEEKATRLERERRSAEERYHDANGRLAASEIRQRTLEEWRDRLLVELEEERAAHRRLDQETTRLYAREKETQADLERLHRREDELTASVETQSAEIARLQEREKDLEERLRESAAETERLYGRERQLTAELEEQVAGYQREQAAWEERARGAEEQVATAGRELEAAHAAHGDVSERLRLMTEQENRVADELRATHAEIERLNEVIRGMRATRVWRYYEKYRSWRS